jgi:imidazole glycerol-phosphate synthase subunit HisF
MLQIRIIPTLLLKDQGLVKTIKFKDPVYVGDPINAVRIFNDKEVDELILLDITASLEKRDPSYERIGDIVSEAFMPVGYGGGITSLKQMERLFKIGIEKIIFNTSALANIQLIKESTKIFGNQSIVISIDIKKGLFGDYIIYSCGGRIKQKISLDDYVKMIEEYGAGELFLSSIDRDGTMKGYDLNLIKKVTSLISIPVIASGGAGKLEDFIEAVKDGGADAVAAGSMFVFQGVYRAVLISYPDTEKINRLIEQIKA